jgi:outer membrane protein TolC
MRWRHWSIAAALAAAQPVAGQSPARLTLEDAWALAATQNPELQAQRNDRVATRAARRAAVAGLAPQLVVGQSFGYVAAGERRLGDLRFQEQPAFLSSAYRLGLQWEIGPQRWLEPAAARVADDVAAAGAEAAAAALRRQVTEQYLAAREAADQRAQAAVEYARARAYERLARARADAGLASPVDVRRAERAVLEAEAAQLQADGAWRAALAALGRALGVPLPDSLELATQFDVFPLPLPYEELRRRAEAISPALAAIRARRRQSELEVRRARAAYWPTISLNVGWTGSVYRPVDLDPVVRNQLASVGQAYAECQTDAEVRRRVGLPVPDCQALNPADPALQAALRARLQADASRYPFRFDREPWSAQLTLSWPVFTGFRRRAQLVQARVSADDAAWQERREVLALETQLRTAWDDAQQARASVDLQERLVAVAREELRLAEERYRVGLGTGLEVVDAQAALARAEQARIRAVYAFHRAVAALEALSGVTLRPAFSTPSTPSNRP